MLMNLLQNLQQSTKHHQSLEKMNKKLKRKMAEKICGELTRKEKIIALFNKGCSIYQIELILGNKISNRTREYFNEELFKGIQK